MRKRTQEKFIHFPLAILPFILLLLGNDVSAQQNSPSIPSIPSKSEPQIEASLISSLLNQAIQIYIDDKNAYEEANKQKEIREDANLAAQQEVARWAKPMTFITGIQLLLSAITLWFLYKTFGENKRTADAAIKATEAAYKSIEISQKTFDQLERPYLYIFNVQLDQPNKRITGGLEPRIKFSIGNFGRLPASINNVLITVDTPPDSERPSPIRIDSDHNLFVAPVFGPSEKRDDLLFIPDPNLFVLTHNLHSPFKTKEQDTYCVIEIHYQGPFSKNHVTDIFLRWDDASFGFIKVDDEKYNRNT